MATQTTNYGLTMPSYNEVADIEVINENMDLIDAQMKKNADGVGQAKSIVSDLYSGSLTYNVGDYCIYDNKLYRCVAAVTTAEAFDSAKWQETSVKSELSTLNSNKINKENIHTYKTSATIPANSYITIELPSYMKNHTYYSVNCNGWSGQVFANIENGQWIYIRNFNGGECSTNVEVIAFDL